MAESLPHSIILVFMQRLDWRVLSPVFFQRQLSVREPRGRLVFSSGMLLRSSPVYPANTLFHFISLSGNSSWRLFELRSDSTLQVRVLQLLLINLSLYSISASMLDRFEKDVGMIDSSLAGSLQALNILLAGFFAAIVTVA